MRRVTPQPIIGNDLSASLLDRFREYSVALNQCADHRLSEFVSVTGTYTAGQNDHVIECAPSGAMTVTLPAASVMRNKRIVIKRTNNTTHTVTIQSSSGNIDGAASVTLTTAHQSREVFSDGTNWWLLDLAISTETASTWDSADQTGVWTLTNSDLTAEVASGTAIRSVIGTTGKADGKRYFEIVFVSGGSFGTLVRHDMGVTLSKPVVSGASGEGTGAGYRRGGAIYIAGSSVGTVTAVSASDVIGVAIDIDSGKVWFALNGTWTQGDPGADTSEEGTVTASQTYYPFASSESGAAMKVTLRTTASEFSYSVPTGFTSWGTS